MACENCNNCKEDKKAAELSAADSRIVAEMTAKQDRTTKIVFGLWVATVAILAVALVWTVNNAQRVANEAMLTALETVAEVQATSETSTTTTTEITMDTGEGDGNNVYLDGDNTTYNEGNGAE